MTYQERRAIYRAYLRMKEWEEDWHGASDAANDLRELDANERTATARARFGSHRDARESSISGTDLRISSICEAGEEAPTPERFS